MDIIETSEGSRTGYLATDAIDYANCIAKILYSTKEENDKIREAARLVLHNFHVFVFFFFEIQTSCSSIN